MDDRYFPVMCPRCKWEGSSKDAAGGTSIADTGDFDDIYCPRCFKKGEGEVVYLICMDDTEYGVMVEGKLREYKEEIDRLKSDFKLFAASHETREVLHAKPDKPLVSPLVEDVEEDAGGYPDVVSVTVENPHWKVGDGMLDKTGKEDYVIGQIAIVSKGKDDKDIEIVLFDSKGKKRGIISVTRRDEA